MPHDIAAIVTPRSIARSVRPSAAHQAAERALDIARIQRQELRQIRAGAQPFDIMRVLARKTAGSRPAWATAPQRARQHEDGVDARHLEVNGFTGGICRRSRDAGEARARSSAGCVFNPATSARS